MIKKYRRGHEFSVHASLGELGELHPPDSIEPYGKSIGHVNEESSSVALLRYNESHGKHHQVPAWYTDVYGKALRDGPSCKVTPYK